MKRALFSVILIVALLSSLPPSAVMAVVSGYSYRKAIAIAGSSDGIQTDYQMQIEARYDDYYITAKAQGYPQHQFNKPVSAYYNGYTYYVWQGAKTTGDGDPYITRYNHSTGIWDPPVRIAANPLPADDKHGSPIILIRTDAGKEGKIIVAFGGHGDYWIQWTESTNAEDITEWSAAANLGRGSFPRLIQAANGDVYAFYRTGAGADSRYQGFRKISSGGGAWSAETTILDWTADGGNSSYEIISTLPAYDTVANKMWFATAQLDASIAGGNSYRDQYVFAYDLDDNRVYDISGNNFPVPVARSVFDNALYKFKAHDATGNETSYPASLGLDENKYPHIVFGDYDGSANYYQKYVKWNGAAWTAAATITGVDGIWDKFTPATRVISSTDIDVYLTDGGDLQEWHYNGAWSQTATVLDVSNEPANITQVAFPSITTNAQDDFFLAFPGLDTTNFDDERVYAYGNAGLVPWNAPGYVTLEGNSQADFDDVRFTTSDGATELDHWRMEKVDSQWATFWVEVNSIAASPTETNIYAYYGNSGASSGSSGPNTFPLFDDFELNNLSRWTTAEAQWSTQGTTTKYDSYAAYGQGAVANRILNKTITVSSSFALHAWVRPNTTLRYVLSPLLTQDAAFTYPMSFGGDTDAVIQYYDGAYNAFSPNMTYAANTWYETNIYADLPNGLHKVGIRDTYPELAETLSANVTSVLSTSNITVIDYWVAPLAARNVYLDNVYLRKWTLNEPEFGDVGAEEDLDALGSYDPNPPGGGPGFGASVNVTVSAIPDNANNITLGSNATPHIGSYILAVGGNQQVRYEPNAIISGTTLPDRGSDATANDGTITWGSNPTGVSTSMGALTSTTVVTANTTVSSYIGSFMPGNVAPSDNWSPTLNEAQAAVENDIFYPFVQPFADISNTPGVFFYWMGTIIAGIVGFILGWRTKHLLISAIAFDVPFGYGIAKDFVPEWAIIVLVIWTIGAAVQEAKM